MSDVSKTNEELISEAREAADGIAYERLDIADILTELTTALEAKTGVRVDMSSAVGVEIQLATRVPIQGEPNGHREAPRVSMEVIREYRHILAWLEEQSALRAPTGDTMHGLAAEALSVLIEHEYSRHEIPLYGMLDVWKALYETSHPEWDEFYEKHGYAETWARLLDEVRSRATVPDAATEAIDRVRALHLIEPGTGPDYCAECEQKYPCPTIQALDGAPEPEGRWEYRGRLQSCGYVAEGYISAEHAMNGLKVELEDHPYLVMDDTAIVERARVRVWLPVEGGSK